MTEQGADAVRQQAAGGPRVQLQHAALAVLVLAMLFGLVLPVYTDEIAWRFHERAWLDNGFDVWLNDVCGPNMVAQAPLLFMPARWFSATMNLLLDDPIWIRLTGVVLGLALVSGFWRLAGLLEPDAERRGLLRAIVCSALATGVLPLLLILSRPEQPVFLAAMAMALLTVPTLGRELSARRTWLLCLAIVVLVLLGLSYHLKGLLYSVFGLACLAVLGGGKRHILPRALAAIAIVALDLIAMHYWLDRFSCTGNDVMARSLNMQSVASLIMTGQASFALVVEQIQNSHIGSYFAMAAIHPYPMSSWVPSKVFSPAEAVLGHGLTYSTWFAPTLVALVAAVAFAFEKGWRALLEPRVVLAGSLFAITGVWALSQIARHVYEASHMLPAWIMAVLFVLTLKPVPELLSAGVMRKLASVLLVFSIICQVIVIGRLAGPLWSAAHDPGRLPEQQYSFSLADYAGVRADIRSAMRQAGMGEDGGHTGGTGPDGRLNRLLIDDLTYLEMQRSYLPLHALGVMGPWNGPINDPATFLVSRDSDGIVASCSSLWQEAADVAVRVGEICAVNREQLRSLAGGRPFVPADRKETLPLADGAYPRQANGEEQEAFPSDNESPGN